MRLARQAMSSLSQSRRRVSTSGGPTTCCGAYVGARAGSGGISIGFGAGRGWRGLASGEGRGRAGRVMGRVAGRGFVGACGLGAGVVSGAAGADGRLDFRNSRRICRSSSRERSILVPHRQQSAVISQSRTVIGARQSGHAQATTPPLSQNLSPGREGSVEPLATARARATAAL